MECNSVDRVDSIPSSFWFPMALESISKCHKTINKQHKKGSICCPTVHACRVKSFPAIAWSNMQVDVHLGKHVNKNPQETFLAMEYVHHAKLWLKYLWIFQLKREYAALYSFSASFTYMVPHNGITHKPQQKALTLKRNNNKSSSTVFTANTQK